MGAFSCPVAKKLNKLGAVIHAFEAQRIVFQQLCGNVFLNGLDNVHTYNVAVGATSGVIRIPRIDYQKTQNIGAVSLIPEIQKVTQVAYSETCYEEVKMQSIDSIDLKGKCTFVKIDVEGYESEVIAGMVGFIEKSCFPAIFFEEWRKGKFSGEAGITVEKRQVKTRELLSQIGYSFTNLGTDVIAQHPNAISRLSFFRQYDQTIKIVRETS